MQGVYDHLKKKKKMETKLTHGSVMYQGIILAAT